MSSKKVTFFHYPNLGTTMCSIKDKNYCAVGVATFNTEGIEEVPNKLVGESIAYSKATRKILLQKIQDKKLLLKHYKDFCIYLFPDRIYFKLKWLQPRIDKKLKEIQKEITQLEKEVSELNSSLEDYILQRKDFLTKVKKKRSKGEK